MTLSRRHLLSAAGAGLVPMMPGLNMAFAANGASTNTLVFLFLRFGMDGLQLLAPADEAGYRDRRPTIGLRTTGGGSGVALDTLDKVQFFLHPQALQFREMYKAGTLAFVHAAGVPTAQRSHFEVQDMAVRGMADDERYVDSGWMARHFQTRPGTASEFAASSDGSPVNSALRGVFGMVPTSQLDTMRYIVTEEREPLLRALNSDNSAVARSIRQTLDTVAVVRDKIQSLPPTPNPNYTYGALSQTLQPLARAIKLDVGVELATVDFGGWDHHDQLPGLFANQARELSNALFAFTDDLGSAMNRVTVVAMTEFGRRVSQNGSNGTDHGAASVMMVLGGGVKGGKIYGSWPGLNDADLDNGDLRVTTDYRQVLAEVLQKRQGQTAVEGVFPTVAYKPLGLIT